MQDFSDLIDENNIRFFDIVGDFFNIFNLIINKKTELEDS